MPRRSRIHLSLITLAVAAAALAVVRDPGAPPALAHVAFGRGPAIVLVHGLAGSPSQWLPVARRLAERYRVVLVELPGHGRSPMPSPFSLEEAARGLERAIEQSSEDPVILVGHSVGGLVAAEVAAHRPERVRGLVLVETALRPQVDSRTRDTMLRALDTDYEAFVKGAYRSFGRDSAQGEVLAMEAATMDPAVMKPWIRLALTVDASDLAAGIPMPTRAILSDRSWSVGESWNATAEALGYERIAHLEPIRVSHAGHFVMLDDPDAVARALTRFAVSFEVGPVAAR